MNTKSFHIASSLIFSIITVLHILRLIFQWDAIIGGWAVPYWFSGIAILIFGYLAYSAFRLR